MKMLKKVISFSIIISSVIFALPVQNVSADERNYSISSTLNDGWTSDAISRTLIAAADLGENLKMTGCTAAVGDDAGVGK